MAKDDFTAFLGSGTEYNGTLKFSGTVRVDCRFVGDIISEGKLILGKEAYFEGNLSVSELVVHGTLNGDALVTGRTILHQNAKVGGSLRTPALIMEEGAQLQGELVMGKDASTQHKSGSDGQVSGKHEHSANIIDATVKQ